MANGLSSNYDDQDYLLECLDCELPELCCDEACEGRIWIAPCGTIDYDTGLIDDNARPMFCEPIGITSMSHTNQAPIREKRYQGCKVARRRGIPDFTISLSFDICQSDNAIAWLLGDCPIDFLIAPKANNMNFELNDVFGQRTKVIWGRMIGDTYTWEYPEDDCQSTTREFMQDRYCWQTQPESLIPDGN